MIEDDPTEDDHPVVTKVVGWLEVEDECYVLSERAQSELVRELDLLLDSWGLPLAVDGLLRLAHVLEAEWGSPQAAVAICEALERDTILDGLRALAQQAREQLEASADSAAAEPFRQFTDSTAKTAPKVGETPPEGAVKLDAFKSRRRV